MEAISAACSTSSSSRPRRTTTDESSRAHLPAVVGAQRHRAVRPADHADRRRSYARLGCDSGHCAPGSMHTTSTQWKSTPRPAAIARSAIGSPLFSRDRHLARNAQKPGLRGKERNRADPETIVIAGPAATLLLLLLLLLSVLSRCGAVAGSPHRARYGRPELGGTGSAADAATRLLAAPWAATWSPASSRSQLRT